MTRPGALPAVDDVTTAGPGRIIARKAVRASDPYLVGHYPGFPIYPGVFILETVRQALARALDERGSPGAPALHAIELSRFSAPLLAGDVLVADIEYREDGDDAVRVTADCVNDHDVRVAKLRLRYTLIRRGHDA